MSILKKLTFEKNFKNRDMKLHLVGGFLGSGKTTAITNASKILSDKNIETTVITNDQGYYLVDSRFVEKSNISFGEVTGGCFCCNYNQLDTQISTLIKKSYPSVIFAESVGTCTDLVSTVLKPLMKFRKSDIDQVTFSSFVDSQLLLMFLKGKALPFSLETNYIWEKQLEEAEIIIVNKIDLLSESDLGILKLLTKEFFPSKHLLFQNSIEKDSINKWIEIISKPQAIKEHKIIEVDYNKYALGEANLAWLDEEIEIITTNNSSVELTYNLIEKLTSNISQKQLPIGHLKFYMSFNDQSIKLSYTTILDKNTQRTIPFEKSNSVNLLVNARIQSSPDQLRKIFIDEINQLKRQNELTINEKNFSCFQPGFPKPTHRLA